MPMLPQLGPAHMGMQYMPMAPQQPLAPQWGPQAFQGASQAFQGAPQGLSHATSRRAPARQAGSALKIPDMGNTNGQFPMQPQQYQHQQQTGFMQGPWGSPFGAGQPQYPPQYSQQAAGTQGAGAQPNAFGSYPANGYPGVQSTGMLPRRAKNRANAASFGQTGMQQHPAGMQPMGGQMQHAGHPGPGMGGLPPSMYGGLPNIGQGQGMAYPAMQQRADVMQQFQLQHYQQTQANVMQHLQQTQSHALLKYGKFDKTEQSQSADLRQRPEFRTY